MIIMFNLQQSDRIIKINSLVQHMMIVLFVSKLSCVFAKENSSSDVRQSFYYYDKLNNFIKVEHLNKDFGLIKLKFIKSNLFQKPSEDKLKGFLTKLIETDVQCTFRKCSVISHHVQATHAQVVLKNVIVMMIVVEF